MPAGVSVAQIVQCANFLNGLGLVYKSIASPHYPPDIAARCRALGYREVWAYLYAEGLYNIQLTDGALMQFRNEGNAGDVSYVYYECPVKAIGYIEFMVRVLGLVKAQFSDAYQPEYEQYLETCEPKSAPTPIRYDYKPDDYKEGRHPASHIHFGHQNNIRLGAKKVLKPMSFTLFVIRQVYPEVWAQHVLTHKSATVWCKSIRDNLADISKHCFNANDRHEMYMH